MVRSTPDNRVPEKFEWLAQDIWNPEFGDIKGKYALYLLNDFENKYEDVDNLVDDMNEIYPDIEQKVDLPEDEFVYERKEKHKIVEVLELDDRYSLKLEKGPQVYLDKKYGKKPKKWDEVTLYLDGLFLKWMNINWERVYANTERQIKKKKLYAEQKELKENLKKLPEEILEIKSRYKELPEYFQERLLELNWLEQLPSWENIKDMTLQDKLKLSETLLSLWWMLEIFEEAIKVVDVVQSLKEIDELFDLSDEELQKKIPWLNTLWNSFSYVIGEAKRYFKLKNNLE